MTFITENKTLYKTALSDLQGAWINLRQEVVDNHPFKDSERLLFQIDEAMSWESVRDLDYMKKILILVRNIAVKAKAPQEVRYAIEQVYHDLNAVFEAMAKGEIG
jgi:hypothetical protein